MIKEKMTSCSMKASVLKELNFYKISNEFKSHSDAIEYLILSSRGVCPGQCKNQDFLCGDCFRLSQYLPYDEV